MTETITLLATAASGLIALTIATLAALCGWQGWLDLRRFELTQARAETSGVSAAERIELADLRERIRKLESIAACVDL